MKAQPPARAEGCAPGRKESDRGRAAVSDLDPSIWPSPENGNRHVLGRWVGVGRNEHDRRDDALVAANSPSARLRPVLLATAALVDTSAPQLGGVAAGGPDEEESRRLLEHAKDLRSRLAGDWWRSNAQWVRQLEGRVAAGERPFVRHDATRLVDQRAWEVARQLARDPDSGARVTLTADDLLTPLHAAHTSRALSRS
jgi:hypothetical protein